MKRIVKISDLCDNCDDFRFGYMGIDLDTREVKMYSDDMRRHNGELIYEINEEDDDFYWEFYHNGESKKISFNNLNEEGKKLLLDNIDKQINYTKEIGQETSDLNLLLNNITFGNVEKQYLDRLSYYGLWNQLFISNLKLLLENKENKDIPTKEEINEYYSLKASINVYGLTGSGMGKGKYYEDRRKQHEEELKKMKSESMQRVKKYFMDKTNEKKNKAKCLSSILFALGEAKLTSVTFDEEKNIIKVKTGFYERDYKVEEIKNTEDGNTFMFINPTEYYENKTGIILESIFNDVECRKIDENYKSVISKTYGPLLDFITDGKLSKARYNGGINEFHNIMCEIIPDNKLPEKLFELIEINSDEKEIYDILTSYIEAKIDSLNITDRDLLYKYIKKCKELGAKNIKQEVNCINEYIESSLEYDSITKLYKKLVSYSYDGKSYRKISNLVVEIEELAKNNNEVLELQILNIFAQKYFYKFRTTALCQKGKIGMMTSLSFEHRVEEETTTYGEYGEIFVDMHGKTKKEIQKIEDRFKIFIPENLKDALIYEKDMVEEMDKLFISKNNRKTLSSSLIKIKKKFNNHK